MIIHIYVFDLCSNHFTHDSSDSVGRGVHDRILPYPRDVSTIFQNDKFHTKNLVVVVVINF